MLHFRRSEYETRVEIMPLIDVIFLLLTFFIYAMVLMKRVDMLPMALPEFAAGTGQAEPEPAVTVSIDEAGALFLDRQPISADAILAQVMQAVADDPRTVVYIASAADGSTDRLPVFLNLYDQFAAQGFTIRLVGMPTDTE